MTSAADAAPATTPHTALRACAGATAGLLLAATLTGCTAFPFFQPAPAPVAVAPALVVPKRPSWSAPPAEAVAESDADGVARLEAFAEVWQTVRWFHPDVVGRAGAWDTAYLRHVDAARTASSNDAFIAAVHAMLGELDDVNTGVVTALDAPATSNGTAPYASALVVHTADSLVIARPIGFAAARERALQQRVYGGAMTEQLSRHVAVLDLRADAGGRGDQGWQVRAPDAREWPQPAGAAAVAIRRAVLRDGRTSLGGEKDCCARWSVRTERAVATQPTAATPGERADASATSNGSVDVNASVATPPTRIAVIVNDASVIPAALLSLHASGHVVFVSTGSGVLRTDVATAHIPLVGGLMARIRTEELLLPDGRAVPTRADTVVALPSASPTDGTLQRPDTADAAVQAALQLVRTAAVNGAAESPSPPRPAESQPSRWRVADETIGAGRTASLSDLSASPAIYPSHPERLLAVTQLWSTVRLFNPYLPMADESWDAMYREALVDVERASSSRTYAAALFRFAARTDASQVTVTVPDHPEFGRRAGQAPLRLRLVDRRALVAAIHDSAAERSGVQVGDEVVSIGGEPIDKRLGRLRDLMPASNSWSRDQQLERWLESGPATVKATFRVQRGSTTPRDLEFAYIAPDAAVIGPSTNSPAAPSVGADVRTTRTLDSLSDGHWLVRLETHAPRTAVAEWPVVPALPVALASAEGVIVDARGVASDFALRWLAGSLLDANGESYARDAVSELASPPQGALRTPELDPARRFTWTARAAPATPSAFAGPMVILVDATTRGDGELLALRLAAGGQMRMVMGSTTAGAVGDVRTVLLPGGVRVQLPVTDVRQPDGRFVQRLGVPPGMVVVPTVDGVRAGRDEQLEAARQWLRQRLAPPSRRR